MKRIYPPLNSGPLFFTFPLKFGLDILWLPQSPIYLQYAQVFHTKNAQEALTRSSPNTPKDILTRSSPLIHKKDDLQETIAILFILSSSRSLNPFLGHLTHF
jgi:hypothetical protein